jgi:uncharacterized protein (DUF58 family)
VVLTRLLSPSAIAAVDDLELAARLIVEGAHTGRHRSPFHGFAAEFSQHRPYRPGDDLKHLDWKILGRTDRLYSRRFHETTNLSAMLVIDTSGSMNFPSERAPAHGAPPIVSKFRYAVMMAAALAHVLIAQGDRVGLITMQRDRFSYLPPKGGRPHLHALSTLLARLEPAGAFPLDRVAARGGELMRRPGVLIVISDLYDAADSTYRELRGVNGRHDVALLQVLSREEITFPYSGDVEFEDLEADGRRVLDADDAAGRYRDAMATFVARQRADAHRDGHDYALLPTDVAPERALRAYLLRRARASARPSGARAGRR